MVPNLLSQLLPATGPVPAGAAASVADNPGADVFANLLAQFSGAAHSAPQATPEANSQVDASISVITPAPVMAPPAQAEPAAAAAPVPAKPAAAKDARSTDAKSSDNDDQDAPVPAADPTNQASPLLPVPITPPVPAPQTVVPPAETAEAGAIAPAKPPAKASPAKPDVPAPSDADLADDLASADSAPSKDTKSSAKAPKPAARNQPASPLKDTAPTVAQADPQTAAPLKTTQKPAATNTFTDPAPRIAARTDDPAPVATATAADPGKPAQAFSLQPAANTPASTYGPSVAPDAPPATSLSQVAVESLSALSVQISKRLKDGNSKFALELHPADLGRVDVALNIARDGKVSAHLSFDSPVTATAFHARESELRQQLAQAGLDVSGDALSFSSRDSGANSGAPQQDQPQPRLPQALRALADAAQTAADADPDTLINQLRRPASRLALDLLV